MFMEEKNNQKQKTEIIEELNFVLQKFLLRTSVLEQEQEILGTEIKHLMKMMKMKKLYQHIINKH